MSQQEMLIQATASTSLKPAVRLLPVFLAATLGLFVLGFAGFANIEAVHNAVHDARHAAGFPCH